MASRQKAFVETCENLASTAASIQTPTRCGYAWYRAGYPEENLGVARITLLHEDNYVQRVRLARQRHQADRASIVLTATTVFYGCCQTNSNQSWLGSAILGGPEVNMTRRPHSVALKKKATHGSIPPHKIPKYLLPWYVKRSRNRVRLRPSFLAILNLSRLSCAGETANA